MPGDLPYGHLIKHTYNSEDLFLPSAPTVLHVLVLPNLSLPEHKSSTYWDGEGPSLELTLSRELDINPDHVIEITLDFDYGARIYQYKIRLDHLQLGIKREPVSRLSVDELSLFIRYQLIDNRFLLHFCLSHLILPIDHGSCHTSKALSRPMKMR